MSRTGRGVLERRGCSALCWQGSESMRYAVLLLVGLLLAACSPEDTTVTPSPSPTQAPTATPSASPSATESKAVPAERHGIDVSHHQGAIDWERVAADGVEFAYLKATEGGGFSDPRFVSNARGAKAAGIKVGAYHYYTPCASRSE